MVELVPSYILKADRAEKHLGDLKFAIAAWANTHPYEMRPGREGKMQLHFTAGPPQQIGIIAADFVYNIRSGLDHLMAALVPSAQRSEVYFPIYFEGVWDDPVPGEDQKRTKERRRWNAHTEKVRPEAVAILKSLQPKETTGQFNSLLLASRVSNRDKHQNLPVLFTSLRGMRVIWKTASGERQIGPSDTGDAAIDAAVCKDGTEFYLTPNAMGVEVTGSPVIAVQIGDPVRNVEIPYAFDRALGAFRNRAIGPLAPYVHTPGRA